MNCFDVDINLVDEHAATFSLHNKTYRSQVLNLLKTCFPHTQRQITQKSYFTQGQRIICLYKAKSATDVEIIAVCFLQQIGVDKCFIHSVCVKKGRQGQKCCDRLFSYLVTSYGKYELSLYVRVDTYRGIGMSANMAALKCYSRYGFVLVDELCVMERDGLNCKMIRTKSSMIDRATGGTS